jgi:Zn-dependent peptidase ImmA (M78 family)
MPAADIFGDLQGIDLKKALDLKPYWKVAAQALILRAQSLGIISPARSRSLHAYMNKVGYLKAEPLPLAREEPELLREMLRIHIEEHGYSTAALGQALGMQEEDVRSELEVQEQRGLRIVR